MIANAVILIEREFSQLVYIFDFLFSYSPLKSLCGKALRLLLWAWFSETDTRRLDRRTRALTLSCDSTSAGYVKTGITISKYKSSDHLIQAKSSSSTSKYFRKADKVLCPGIFWMTFNGTHRLCIAMLNEVQCIGKADYFPNKKPSPWGKGHLSGCIYFFFNSPLLYKRQEE